ncbi:hypothetical protein G6011_07621 [Alternaria panax]|uniref:Uncharacterized protein n=1 Tax=Alternaria panax TaxID=48097 RepID=A0AAD4FFY0_9PLEO|nr:hypothetical protein G6011_07621 [Alternaria panax]
MSAKRINKIAEGVDGTGGVDGYCWITYTLTKAGCGLTVFTRNLTCELEKGVEVPEDLWVAMSRPSGIDKYHAAIAKRLDEETGEHRILDA